ncbi:MAG: tetratricopeptide repeat protein [Pyrinomonadaceae bacterium]
MKNRYFSKLTPLAFFLVALSILSVVDVAAQSKKDRKRADDLVKEGDKSFNQKNYSVAMDSYTQSLAIVSKNSYAHYRKGFAHYYLKEPDQGIMEFDIALAQGYKPVEVFKARWQLHFEVKNYDAAIADLKQLSKAEPNNGDYFVGLADATFEKGSFQEADDAYQKAILKFPGNGNLFYKLALAKSKVGDIDGQASAAEEAVKKNTQYLAESYRLIGDARVRQRRIPEAIDAYERALKSKPDVYEAYRNLSELYRAENRLSDAIEISKAGLRQYPSDGKIFTDISGYYSLAGRNDDAIEAGRAATRLLPKQAVGYTNLCRAYNDANKPEMAISTCNTALRLNPNDGETNFYLGRAHAILQKPVDADRYYKRAVVGLLEFTKNNPEYSDGFYLLGNAYAEDGQSANALEAYRKCLELNPRFVKAIFNIGIIQIGRKDKAAAMDQYSNLLNLDKSLAGKLKAEIDKL